MAAARVPGLALALVDQGEVVYEHAYGFAERDAGAALRTDTVMYAASLTKAAFSYLVMQLVDAGALTPALALLTRVRASRYFSSWSKSGPVRLSRSSCSGASSIASE
jgi:CubicO group peptidase (beta-lactamase class C family)